MLKAKLDLRQERYQYSAYEHRLGALRVEERSDKKSWIPNPQYRSRTTGSPLRDGEVAAY